MSSSGFLPVLTSQGFKSIPCTCGSAPTFSKTGNDFPRARWQVACSSGGDAEKCADPYKQGPSIEYLRAWWRQEMKRNTVVPVRDSGGFIRTSRGLSPESRMRRRQARAIDGINNRTRQERGARETVTPKKSPPGWLLKAFCFLNVHDWRDIDDRGAMRCECCGKWLLREAEAV